MAVSLARSGAARVTAAGESETENLGIVKEKKGEPHDGHVGTGARARCGAPGKIRPVRTRGAHAILGVPCSEGSGLSLQSDLPLSCQILRKLRGPPQAAHFVRVTA